MQGEKELLSYWRWSKHFEFTKQCLVNSKMMAKWISSRLKMHGARTGTAKNVTEFRGCFLSMKSL
jgi:hypothetical protein